MGNKRNRVEWIDFAKGITIILVIIGHTVSGGKYGSIIRGLIFSFHMPLFFILSMITYQCSRTFEEFKEKVKLSFRHLIYPAVIMITLNNIIFIIRNPMLAIDVEWWRDRVYEFIFSSGVELTFNNLHVSAIGIPWFFFALFIGRCIFDYIHLQFKEGQLLIITIIIGISGICISTYQWLPFSLDIALSIMPFFYIGYKLKTLSVKNAGKRCCIWCVVWLVTLYVTFNDYNVWTYLELAIRRYNGFPICYIAAISGTMFVLLFGIIFCRHSKIIKKPFLFLGKNSLYMLCIHIIDYLFINFWNRDGNQYYSAILRVIVDSVIFLMVMFITKVLKLIKIYILKNSKTKDL